MVDESERITDGSPPIEERLAVNLSPGKMLLQARLVAGLSQDHVAKKLYMTVYKVNALEADDYSSLNSDTFARGYLRAYANLVGIDLAVILAAYDELLVQLQPSELVQEKAPIVAENNHRGAWQFLAVIGVFFIALWLISVWFFDNHSDSQYVVPLVDNAPSSVASKAVMENASAIDTSAMVLSSASGESNAAELLAVAPAESKQITSVVVSPDAVNQLDEPSEQVKSTRLDELIFSFREESWLEVSDSRGDVLATELQSAGSKLNLVGLAPFDVKLGNAPAVDVLFNGKKIDVIPLMGSNVLTLKIGK